ncbi:hypothetical protein GLOIN_2v1774909 [Rhizophagus irregularis DAOM 181602=DAOM 197198]|nr:hypothetical protein GLOIN_2v1774909 [Rhizophagus irregularis DAOM 181602=DAOM 197198]
MMRFILNHSTSHSSDDAFVIWIKIVLSATSAIKAEKQNDFAGVDADSRTTRVDFHLLEIREKLGSLQALLNKSVHAFDVIQRDIHLGTIKTSAKCSGYSYQITASSLLYSLRLPQKPFFPKVSELYGLSDDPNPSTDMYPVFHCGYVDLKDEKSQSMVKHLMAELELCQKTTSLDVAYEATKTIYSYCYLASRVSFYEKNFKIIPEKLITGHNGQGNLDYAIECRSSLV